LEAIIREVRWSLSGWLLKLDLRFSFAACCVCFELMFVGWESSLWLSMCEVVEVRVVRLALALKARECRCIEVWLSV
jgi:hypothetical protein